MTFINKIFFKDTEIPLNGRNLILTGNNGSGKTYLLNNLRTVLEDTKKNKKLDIIYEEKKKLIKILKYLLDKYSSSFKLTKSDIELISDAINSKKSNSNMLIKDINTLVKERYEVFLKEKDNYFLKQPKLSSQQFMIESIKNPELEKYFHFYLPEYLENITKMVDDHTQNILKNKNKLEILFFNELIPESNFFSSSRVPSIEGLEIKVSQSYEILKKHYDKNESPNLLEAYLISIRKDINQVKINQLGKTGTTIWSISDIQKWFIKVENDLKEVLENQTLELSFSNDGNEVRLKTNTPNRNFTFDQLSSGYKAIFYIYSTLLMEAQIKQIAPENLTGITLIDEIDVHLHINLQKKILPFLIKAFPKIQFIVSTHSPFVITSTNNDTVVYDISNDEFFEDNLSQYSYESVIKGLFHVSSNSDERLCCTKI